MNTLVRRTNLVIDVSSQSARPNENLGLDAITLDWLPDRAKSVGQLVSATEALAADGVDVFVGIRADDVELLPPTFGDGICGLMVHGARSRAQLRPVWNWMDRLGGHRTQPAEVVVIVEDAVGLWSLPEWLGDDERISQIAFDEASYIAFCGIEPSELADPCRFARASVVLQAVSHGIQPLACPPVGAFGSGVGALAPVTVSETTKHLGQLGFKGMVFRDAAWAMGRTGFDPSEEDVIYAEEVKRTFSAAVSKGHAAARLEGRMIDTATDDWATNLLERAQACHKRDDRRRR
jgi:citrate lyase beta subunit